MAKVAQEYTLFDLLKSLGRSKKPLPGASVSVGVTTTQIVKANKNRRSLVITNTSGVAIFLGIGESAVLNQGIYLAANGGIWEMDSYTYSINAINGITTAGPANVAVQEFE